MDYLYYPAFVAALETGQSQPANVRASGVRAQPEVAVQHFLKKSG